MEYGIILSLEIFGLTNKSFLINLSVCIVLIIAAITGPTVTTNVHAQTKPQTLPNCTDPTGRNLPCLIILSTLPVPSNAVQCQETTGQILSCSYATQTLSNGQQVVVITVYVPPNFVFNNPTMIKVVVHETIKTKIIRQEPRGIGLGMTGPVCRGIQGVHGCIVFLPGGPGQPPFPIYLSSLPPGPHTVAFRLGWFYGNTGSDYYNPYPPGSRDWTTFNLGVDQGFKASTPYTNCEHFDTCPDPKYDPTKDPKYKPQSLPTPCVSPQGIDYCNHATLNPLGHLVPSHGNEAGVISCINNCTSGTQTSPEDCTKNPNDPSCTQTLTPSVSTSSPVDCKKNPSDPSCMQSKPQSLTSSTNPTTTKKCPDGSTIPAKDKCPASKQTNPSSPLTGPSSPSGSGLSSPSEGSSSGGETGSGGSGGGSSGSSGGGSESSDGSSSTGGRGGGSGSSSSSSGSSSGSG